MILHAVSWSFNIWHDIFKFRYKLYLIIILDAKSCNVDISLLAYLLISSELELKLSVIRKLIWAICRIFFPCLQRSLTTRQKCLFLPRRERPLQTGKMFFLQNINWYSAKKVSVFIMPNFTIWAIKTWSFHCQCQCLVLRYSAGQIWNFNI